MCEEDNKVSIVRWWIKTQEENIERKRTQKINNKWEITYKENKLIKEIEKKNTQV